MGNDGRQRIIKDILWCEVELHHSVARPAVRKTRSKNDLDGESDWDNCGFPSRDPAGHGELISTAVPTGA
jgi:hypothetical protein